MKYVIEHPEEEWELDKLSMHLCKLSDKPIPLDAINYIRNFESNGITLIKMDELRVGMKKVGKRNESHWHNYRVKNMTMLYDYFDIIKCADDDVIEQMRLIPTRGFFVGVQYHPEYQSSKDKKHPLLFEFIRYAKSISYVK